VKAIASTSVTFAKRLEIIMKPSAFGFLEEGTMKMANINHLKWITPMLSFILLRGLTADMTSVSFLGASLISALFSEFSVVHN
jgi:hypothetical protein